jgi:hypothetical protein
VGPQRPPFGDHSDFNQKEENAHTHEHGNGRE